MFISPQLNKGLNINVHHVIEVLTERFSQDTLENYFDKQRSSGAGKDTPFLYDLQWHLYGYNDNTIQNQKVFKAIATAIYVIKI